MYKVLAKKIKRRKKEKEGLMKVRSTKIKSNMGQTRRRGSSVLHKRNKGVVPNIKANTRPY